MSKHIWRWLEGTVRVRVEGGLCERFLNECSNLEVSMEDIRAVELGYELSTAPQDVATMRSAARRCRCGFSVVSRTGAPFRLGRYRRRAGLALGALLAAGILLWEPYSVWSIDFYNFTPAQEKKLRRLLYEQGITEGVRSEGAWLDVAESRIISQNPEYAWLQLNFVHGRLVAEKTDASQAPEMQTQEKLTSLVANADGVIRGFELQGGYIQVEPGQSVARGDLLVNAVTVGKRTGKLLYSAARGSVWAETKQVYRCFIPFAMSVAAPSGEKRRSYAVITPLGRIPLGEAEEQTQAAVRTHTHPLTLLGLHIPATLEIRTEYLCEEQTVTLGEELAADIARSRIFDAVGDAMESYEILSSSESADVRDDGVYLTVELNVLTNIAVQVPYTEEMQPEIPSDLF